MYLKWVVTLTGIIIYCVQVPVYAQNEMLEVKLQSLQVVKTQEKYGDELYISVTEFPLNKKASHYQIPAFPSHWLSKYLHNVKDVVIWQKSLNQCEPVNLLISLVEEDLTPWNIDDTLGSVELKVECVNGKAVEKWVIPDPKNTTKTKDDGNEFSFSGENAEYKAIFKVESTSLPK
ncbi:MAG: hypothetical protein HYX61_08435 [Gammaproteobacteria bacterium]|jgi:hypothetical protein|nr:hypothetical protein [Gammaproteobacteria bacterium]